MTTSTIEALETRVRELSRARNAADLEWINARRHAAQLNAFHKAKLANAERALKQAKQRYRDAREQIRSSQALEELRELAPTFNHDSERLADSIQQAKALMAQCDPGATRCDSAIEGAHLPMLLQTPDGQVVMRPRGF